MKLIYDNPAAAGKVTTMAAMPGALLAHGEPVEVPARLVEICLQSGAFRLPTDPPASRRQSNRRQGVKHG